jgi:hypothetical protein
MVVRLPSSELMLFSRFKKQQLCVQVCPPLLPAALLIS